MDFECSARRDLRIWAVFLLGLALFAFSLQLEAPDRSDPEIAVSVLMLLAMRWGAVLAVLVCLQLFWRNARRGSRIDPTSDELVWWKAQGSSLARGGRIATQALAEIRITLDSDGGKSLSLFDRSGARLPYFDAEVVPADLLRWAEALQARLPQIRITMA